MPKIVWNALGLQPVVLSTTLVLANSTLATETPKAEAALDEPVTVTYQPSPVLAQKTQEIQPSIQMTSVSQLSDVRSTDWTFQALQTLAERYGCLAGYPRSTYQDNRTLTRYEFAVGLNACLDQINRSIGTTSMRQEDLATLQRLQAEFTPELATLQGRVDNLEAQTTQLEARPSFSPTTKLTGEAIFATSGVSGGNQADDNNDSKVDKNLSFGSRIRLTFDSSFIGEDRLRARLQTTNAPEFDDATGTDMTRLSFQGNDENELELSRLEYRLPAAEQTTVYIEAVGGSLDDFTDTLNPLSGSGDGSISRFGQRNPIYRQSSGTGVGLAYSFNEAVNLSLGYLGEGSEPEEAVGPQLENGGAYGTIAQLTLQPSKAVGLGLTFVHSYNELDTGTGSQLANDPFDDASDRVTANSYGLEATVEVTSRFTLGGWIGYTEARAEDLAGKPGASIFNYAVTLAFPDLGKEDNLAGIVIGQPPRVARNDLGKNYQDKDTSLHLEAFYRFQATDNIAITPGIVIITSPEHNDDNKAIYLGTVRTTFSF